MEYNSTWFSKEIIKIFVTYSEISRIYFRNYHAHYFEIFCKTNVLLCTEKGN